MLNHPCLVLVLCLSDRPSKRPSQHQSVGYRPAISHRPIHPTMLKPPMGRLSSIALPCLPPWHRVPICLLSCRRRSVLILITVSLTPLSRRTAICFPNLDSKTMPSHRPQLRWSRFSPGPPRPTPALTAPAVVRTGRRCMLTRWDQRSSCISYRSKPLIRNHRRRTRPSTPYRIRISNSSTSHTPILYPTSPETSRRIHLIPIRRLHPM